MRLRRHATAAVEERAMSGLLERVERLEGVVERVSALERALFGRELGLVDDEDAPVPPPPIVEKSPLRVKLRAKKAVVEVETTSSPRRNGKAAAGKVKKGRKYGLGGKVCEGCGQEKGATGFPKGGGKLCRKCLKAGEGNGQANGKANGKAQGTGGRFRFNLTPEHAAQVRSGSIDRDVRTRVLTRLSTLKRDMVIFQDESGQEVKTWTRAEVAAAPEAE